MVENTCYEYSSVHKLNKLSQMEDRTQSSSLLKDATNSPSNFGTGKKFSYYSRVSCRYVGLNHSVWLVVQCISITLLQSFVANVALVFVSSLLSIGQSYVVRSKDGSLRELGASKSTRSIAIILLGCHVCLSNPVYGTYITTSAKTFTNPLK